MSLVDVRATRFGGAWTALVATTVILLATWDAVAALGAAVFLTLVLTLGTLAPRLNLWGVLYRHTLRRVLDPPTPAQLEPVALPRFANLLGALFVGAASLAGILGSTPWLVALTAIVGALAAINATTGFCLGCRLYGFLVLRPHRPGTTARVPSVESVQPVVSAPLATAPGPTRTEPLPSREAVLG